MQPPKYERRHEAMTLHEVMQASIGEGLQSGYNPEREIPHGLLVLLMQMDDEERTGLHQSGDTAKQGARRSR